jgi:hypothetical protein
MMLLRVQSNVAQPKKIRHSTVTRPRKYPFPDMDVGSMFFIPNKAKNTLSSYISTIGKKLGCKFSSRVLTMKQDRKGLWAPCPATDPDAVQGVGVWRLE